MGRRLPREGAPARLMRSPWAKSCPMTKPSEAGRSFERTLAARPMPRLLVLFVAFLLVPSVACQQAAPPASGEGPPAPVQAAHAMVVAGQGDAARVGLDVLRDGGNAIDAAVATGFALAVTLPNAGNVGGGGFLLVRFADGTATSLDFREVAPMAATAAMFRDSTGAMVPGRSTKGHLASGVPGTVAGLLEAHARWGSLPLARLLDPAIALAE